MRIVAQPEGMVKTAEELLHLSKELRTLRYKTEERRNVLGKYSELDECRRELVKQEESLSLMTARLVGLSAAIRQISCLYQTTEEEILENLEELQVQSGGNEPAFCILTDQYRDRVNSILY